MKITRSLNDINFKRIYQFENNMIPQSNCPLNCPRSKLDVNRQMQHQGPTLELALPFYLTM